ncbi:UNVERIFIED_CONTAM: hypothetical protein HDU68_002994, partial [Siphonaria sp. JEL0065]
MSSLVELLQDLTVPTSYIGTHPALFNIWLTFFFVIATFVIGTVSGNYSQVDRLWSISPAIYTANYFIIANLRGYEFNLRLAVMAGLVLAWGSRLTFNFWRKGGYRWKDEDYRWPALRKIITNQILWHTFSLLFISLYQNVLLLLLTVPAKTAFDAVQSGVGFVEWQPLDSIATITFVTLLILETVADQQQWNFQQTKWGMIKKGRKLQNLPAPYNVGFLTTGLFAFSRHPNFFAEF